MNKRQRQTARIGAWRIAAAAVGLVAGGPVGAAPDRPAAIVGEVTACRAQADPARRLACFDAAAAKLEAATASRAIVVVDREAVRETRRSLFGFALPRIGLFGGNGPDAKDGAADAREEISELSTTITRVQPLGHDLYQIMLAEGGTWRSTEAWMGAKLPVVGAKILVRRASLGSYFLKIEGGRVTRGMRVG